MKFKYKNLSVLFILCGMISAENSIDSCQKIIKLEENYECYEENILYDAESCNGAIKWTLTNSTLGLVDVEFNPCGNSNFQISLSVQESDKNICDLNGTWKRHSSYNHRRLRSNKDGLPKCAKIAKVQLKYLFSGCYQIEIEAKYGNGYIPRNRSTEYLDTQYVKYAFQEEDITAKHQQRFADNKTYLITKFKYPQHSQLIQLCFHLGSNLKDDRIVWNISCLVKNTENNCGLTVHGQNKNITCISKTLELDEFIIDCHLFGLIPGSYLFEKYIVNEPIRCNTEENLVWGNKDCHWKHFLNLTEEKFVFPNQVPNSNSSIYLIGISTLVLISILLILIYCLYKKIQKNNLLKNLPDIIYDPGACDDFFDPEILLLYARDRELFMQTMSSFRRMLEIVGNCQIFDIHDPERTADILTKNKNIWLQNKILDNNIKIVLVLSECGNYLVQEQKSYKEPECFDSLYNYGVHILLQNPDLFSRDNLYVTKFSWFNESGPTSIILSPDLYNLDDFDHVQVLVKGLFNQVLEEQLKECVQFNKNCTKLITFVRSNPNYLLDILQIT